MELTDRKRRILRAIVESYIQTAEPVGSKSIAQLPDLNISSATIRNEMADLTEMGYLEQPHTSAGRIPSPKGYRLYVNELMEEHKLSVQETQRINDALHIKMEELDRVISEAGKVVSQLTNLPAFALSAGGGKMTIRRYDLLLVDAGSFIAVVLTNTNVVKNKLIRVPMELTEPQLQMLGTLLNTSFTGKTLEELGPEMSRMAEHASGNTYGLISLVASFALEVLEELDSRLVHTAGVSHLLEHPEYQSVDKAQKLLSYLSNEEEISQLPIPAELVDSDNTKILIGPENVADELKDTSVVLASYDIGDGMKGVIGVVGPTRMDYARVAARLSYFAEGLSRMFGKGELPPASQDSGKLPQPAPEPDEKGGT